MRKNAIIGLVVTGVLSLALAAFATHGFMRIFNQTENPKPNTPLKKAGCAACHIRGDFEKLNPYGKDFGNNGASADALKKIRNLDSDKDGFTNAKEIKAGTLPGDKNSKPKK